MNDIADIAVSTISDIMSTQAECFCFEENQIEGNSIDTTEQLILKTLNFITGRFTEERLNWALSVYLRTRAETMSESQVQLLQTMIESIALAMDRYWSMKQRIRSNEETMQERYRGNMLRAIALICAPFPGLLEHPRCLWI